MEHIVKLTHGHDCIKFECAFNSKDCFPGSGGSHGRHGLTITFLSKGDDGAVQFVLYTGWSPQYTAPDEIGHRYVASWGNGSAMPADLGCHSKKPQYEGQAISGDSCEYCNGEPCYYDGSGLNADDAMYALVNGGGVALWKFLDDYYGCIFQNKDYPVPAEYSKPPRK